MGKYVTDPVELPLQTLVNTANQVLKEIRSLETYTPRVIPKQSPHNPLRYAGTAVSDANKIWEELGVIEPAAKSDANTYQDSRAAGPITSIDAHDQGQEGTCALAATATGIHQRCTSF